MDQVKDWGINKYINLPSGGERSNPMFARKLGIYNLTLALETYNTKK